MELVFIGSAIAGIVWLVVRGRRRRGSEWGSVEQVLIVLDDPNYKERRAMEERRRVWETGTELNEH